MADLHRPISDPRRVLVAGDIHGNIAWALSLVEIAHARGISTILQVGDLAAYWMGARCRLEDALEERLSKYAMEFRFISGNHENFTSLKELRDQRQRPDGLVPLREHIFWIPNATRWAWREVRFGALGGAFSIDFRARRALVDWWPRDEMPTEDDLTRLGSDRLDVLVCHAAPMGVDVPLERIPEEDEAKCAQVRERVTCAVEQTGAALVLHGHHHARRTTKLSIGSGGDRRVVRVESLAADVQGDGSAWGVLDIDTLGFADGNSSSAGET